MSRTATVTLEWGDGDHTFRLLFGGCVEFQEKTDAGPGFARDSISNGTWRVQYVREAIRIGLIGGGMKPTEALRLVKTYVDERPLAENLLVAFAILSAAIEGVPDEPLGKSQGRRRKSGHSPEANSGLVTSTGLAS